MGCENWADITDGHLMQVPIILPQRLSVPQKLLAIWRSAFSVYTVSFEKIDIPITISPIRRETVPITPVRSPGTLASPPPALPSSLSAFCPYRLDFPVVKFHANEIIKFVCICVWLH